MEIPRFNSLSDKSPNALSTAVGDRIVDPSTPTGGAPKRPFGGEPSGRFGVAAQGDAPPVCNGDEWPDGDWVPGRVDAKPPAEWAAIAGAIGAGGSTAAPDANTSPASSAEARETSNPTNSSTHEWPVSDPPRRALGESVGAERDVLLWQRWVRYLGAVLMAVAAAVLHTHSRGAITWAPLFVLALGYGSVTAMVAWFLSYASSETVPPRLPALVMTFDLVAAAGTVYFTAPPRDYDRMLLLGIAAVQVAIVYYGLSSALWGLGGTLAAYLLGSLVVPPAVPGLPATPLTVAADAATFGFAGLVLVYTFGTFRARMNALRRFCRDVEVGDLGGTYDAHAERRPDDLTLLARSVDEMRQRLIELIGTDPLTGCLNRRALETRLARDCRSARRRGTALAVLAVDVDHFKSINDSFGHPFGDYVLHEVAEIMKETARDTDAVARLGGDEFILVLPDTGWQGATAFAERLRRNVDDHIFGDDMTSLQVTISVGVAVARAADDQPPEALLADADRSLYRAKSAGRNRISA